MPRLATGSVYAAALLEEMGIHEFPDLAVIANHLNLEVVEIQADNFDGALVRARDLPIGAIVVRASIREQGRKKFTVAHEIGHFVLPGHDKADLVCTSLEIGAWSAAGNALEREADEFAAELLMPTNLVKPIINRQEPSLTTAQDLATVAATSLSAAAWRYCDLTSERCAIIWSTRLKVAWCKRSSDFLFGITKGAPIERGTFAHDCFNHIPVPDRPYPISSDLWLRSPNVQQSSKIWEHSIPLPSYESVLTLLWIKERIENHSDYDEE